MEQSWTKSLIPKILVFAWGLSPYVQQAPLLPSSSVEKVLGVWWCLKEAGAGKLLHNTLFGGMVFLGIVKVWGG